uniref:Immunoglobulin heavy constant mu n=1 Tax=Cyanistes caeruleus TaxID=156563 RepID=A0A8C0UBY0_CYACU
GSARAPDLFPLSPCGSGTAFSVGCVAVGFTPPPVGFAWRDRENRSAPGAAIFPPVRSSGRFLAASRLGMELEEGKGRQPFWCRAEHARGSRSVQVYNPGEAPNNAPNNGPNIPNNWSKIREKYPLKCDGATPEAPAVEGPGIFVTGSRLVVTEAEWERGDVFTCQAGEESRNTSKAMECGYDQPLSASDIRVETVAPLFADIFRDQAARLTCRVSNLAAGGEGLEVTWLNEEGEALATKMAAPALQPNGLLAAEGVATVSVEAWESGQVFTCRVTHPELLFPREVTMRKSTVPDAAPPTVHLLAPPPEQLRRRTWATLTCLILDFNPPDLLVQWLKDGQPLPSSHALTWKPRPQPSHAPSGHAHQSVSTLTVPARDWEGGHVYTCLVGHERLPLRLAQKSLDKSAGNPAHLNVSLVLSDSAAACY